MDRQRPGDDDPKDAEAAARAVLAAEAAGAPKSGDGRVEVNRTLRSARRSAVKARVQVANLLIGGLLEWDMCGLGTTNQALPSPNWASSPDINKPPIRGQAIRPKVSRNHPITYSMVAVRYLLSLLLVLLMVLFCAACAELELLTGTSGGGAGAPPSGSLSVSFIDVGQGDGVLVQAAGESYLIDAGRAEEGPKVVDFLRSRSVESLEGIVVSNPDADHIGGFLDVLDAFRVESVYVSGDPNNTLTYNTFLRGVRDEGATTEVLRAGALMDWGGVRADVCQSRNTQSPGLRFRALLSEGGDPRVQLHRA